jgi:Spy/CpxP family protein refolding chaperone
MKRTTFLVLLFCVAASAAGSAQPSATPREGARMIHRMEARLGVTPAQIVQIKAILLQEKPALEQLHEQLAAEHAELASLTTFNEEQTEAIEAKYAVVNTSMVVEREKLRFELYAVLTPEQLQTLEQMRARFGSSVDDRLQTLGDSL